MIEIEYVSIRMYEKIFPMQLMQIELFLIPKNIDDHRNQMILIDYNHRYLNKHDQVNIQVQLYPTLMHWLVQLKKNRNRLSKEIELTTNQVFPQDNQEQLMYYVHDVNYHRIGRLFVEMISNVSMNDAWKMMIICLLLKIK
jgi:hypothetical protein